MPVTITDLRRIIEYLPGDMPVLIADPEIGDLYPAEFNVEAVTEDGRYIAHTEDGAPHHEALVIS